MRRKSLLNEKAIIIISLNQSECRKLLQSASSKIGFSRVTGIEESAFKSSCRPLFFCDSQKVTQGPIQSFFSPRETIVTHTMGLTLSANIWF